MWYKSRPSQLQLVQCNSVTDSDFVIVHNPVVACRNVSNCDSYADQITGLKVRQTFDEEHETFPIRRHHSIVVDLFRLVSSEYH